MLKRYLENQVLMETHLLPAWVVEVEGHSLHPGVVGVARVVHIPSDGDMRCHSIEDVLQADQGASNGHEA